MRTELIRGATTTTTTTSMKLLTRTYFSVSSAFFKPLNCSFSFLDRFSQPVMLWIFLPISPTGMDPFAVMMHTTSRSRTFRLSRPPRTNSAYRNENCTTASEGKEYNNSSVQSSTAQ